MEEALVDLLLGSAAVRSLAGASVHWVQRPQTESGLCYVVLQRISGAREPTMQSARGTVQSRVQANCYGASYGQAKALARAVIGTVAGRRFGVFQGIFIDSQRDLPAADPGEVNRLFRTSVDLMIHHTE